MKGKKSVLSCIEYIEKNIKQELTVESIARGIGYSAYHFSRMFKDEMGMSLIEYVRERRLVCASKEIAKGKRLIDLAVEYGYESHGGFTKAFKRKFGFTPSMIYAMYLSCETLSEDGGRYRMNDSKVFITQSVDFKSEGELYRELVEKVNYKEICKDTRLIEEAYQVARRIHEGEKRKSGEDYIIHPLNVALILAEMEASEACIIGGLLHEVGEKDASMTLEAIESQFSNEIANLVEMVKVLGQDITKLEGIPQEVILIKLADRLHDMRTLKHKNPERFKEEARETITFFSPIAAKLGISKIKMELDDLALKYL